MNFKHKILGFLYLLPLILPIAVRADVITNIKSSNSVTIGVRESAGLLSYRFAEGKYGGFHVELCERIVEELKKALKLPQLTVHYRNVTPQNRFALLHNGSISMECGATANTVERAQHVAFAPTTYVEETRVAVRSESGITSLTQLAGKRIAVTAGTTSLQYLKQHPVASNLRFDEVYGKDHSESFALLTSGKADAWVIDSSIIHGNISVSRMPQAYRILNEVLSAEPISIALPKNDPGFKTEVDKIISGFMRDGTLNLIWRKWFESPVPPRGFNLNMQIPPGTRFAWSSPSDDSRSIQRFMDHYRLSSVPVDLLKRAETRQQSASTTPSEVIRASNGQQLSLEIITTKPDSNGLFTISINTNSDTSSLRINSDELGGRKDGRYSIQRVARLGPNPTDFEIVATDIYGNKARKTVAVSRDPIPFVANSIELNPAKVPVLSPRDAVVLIIGIGSYRRVPKADFADADARVFYDYALRTLGARPENIKVLVNEEADRIGIRRALETWLPTVVQKNKTDVFVFYSGHGLPAKDGSALFLLPWDTDRDYIEDTGFSQKTLFELLQNTGARRSTVFIDSCYSGSTRTGETLLANARPLAVRAKAQSVPSNVTLIASSSPDELSSSSPHLKHGIFSYYLMRGMEGDADANSDGLIQTDELFAYVKQSVERESAAMGRRQTPVIYGSRNQVIGRIK